MTSPALSFGSAAELYDAVRPTYPDAAIAWALGGRPLRVLDLGAGTGRLTEVLLRAGHDVVSVDPDEKMLAVLAARFPAAEARNGSAERIAAPDASFDAVVCGQAYHWFIRETALPEIARVLVPGGIFAPVWNFRDESEPWVAELSAIIGSEARDLSRSTMRDGVSGVLEFGPWFTATEHDVFEHTVSLTPDGLVDLVRSRSYFLTASTARKVELVAAVRRLAASHRDLAGRAQFAMPYRTHVYRSRRA
jgi:SAM-dependent methyltransferase